MSSASRGRRYWWQLAATVRSATVMTVLWSAYLATNVVGLVFFPHWWYVLTASLGVFATSMSIATLMHLRRFGGDAGRAGGSRAE